MTGLHVDIDGHGQDLVLLHGWGFHSGAWEAVVPRLAQRYRVHRVDLPGHGHSPPDGVATFEDAVQAVCRCIPAAARVAGWSLGGLIAQRIAARRAGAIAGMALVSTTPCFIERAGWSCAMRAATLEGFAIDLERDAATTLDRFVRLNALHGPHARQNAKTVALRLRERPLPGRAALRQGLEWLREVDLREDAARVGTRCVVVHGTRDAITPVAAGRWLARSIPGARLVELEDAGHLPFVSHADRFVEALELLDD
ncbi:MAG TPA: pimeloyl-ACP methyl ester esterase BioH [Usitatibacter sp.]|jgi:pimeloyl-[acyl-carrier protein] methyl ester esterase|nr:pimeloyl-ACP methyl ester esterase BioH [Usitatibacter sp.]